MPRHAKLLASRACFYYDHDDCCYTALSPALAPAVVAVVIVPVPRRLVVARKGRQTLDTSRALLPSRSLLGRTLSLALPLIPATIRPSRAVFADFVFRFG